MSHRTILLIGSEAVPCKRPRCFDKALIGDGVLRVSNVTQALEYLRDAGAITEGDSSVPALVVVWSAVGSEAVSKLVSWVRSEERLTQTPIVVLASVEEPSHSVMSFEASSKDYLLRVGDTEMLLDVVSRHFPENGC